MTDTETRSAPAYLIFDSESIPDGRLLQLVKYPGESLSEEEAILRAQTEARAASISGSDFIPVTFQIPIAVCVLRVGADFRLQAIVSLDAPSFRPRRIVEQFWNGLERHQEKGRGRVRLVTFNGRGFDLPLLELSAFRFGLSIPAYVVASRKRFDGMHIDLLDWLTNYGAFRMVGGLNLLSKLLGKPGKMAVAGHQVYDLYKQGRLQDISDYCMFDTLDTYFVFLRTRVLTGELTLEQEHAIVLDAKSWIGEQTATYPALSNYIENWGDWNPWP